MEQSKTPSGIIKKKDVRLQGAMSPSLSPASSAGLPSVKAMEEAGKVRSIEVQCACGSKIVIDCEYEGEKKES